MMGFRKCKGIEKLEINDFRPQRFPQSVAIVRITPIIEQPVEAYVINVEFL